VEFEEIELEIASKRKLLEILEDFFDFSRQFFATQEDVVVSMKFKKFCFRKLYNLWKASQSSESFTIFGKLHSLQKASHSPESFTVFTESLTLSKKLQKTSQASQSLAKLKVS
jgi:hypothetical protein